MNKKLIFLGILLLVGLTLSGCVAIGGYGYGGYGYDYGYGNYSYPHSYGYYNYDYGYHNNLAVTGTAIVDHGVEPAIGDEIKGQGVRGIF